MHSPDAGCQEEGEPDWAGALERLRGAYADKTLKEHRSDFAVFKGWCTRKGLSALPASAATLAEFVADGVASWAPRTVQRRLLVIRRVHSLLRLPDATMDEEVHLAMRRAMRAKPQLPRQALGLTSQLRDQLIAVCPPDLKGLRDRALIAVGYDTLCRRSELAALRVEDLVLTSDGAGRVLIGRAKNDPFGEGRYAYFSRSGRKHLQAWLDAAHITSGPIFRPTYKVSVGSRAAHPRVLNRILQQAAERAGVSDNSVRRLSGHSLRVGAAQDLAAAGRTVLQIMRAGRWTHVSSVETYVRYADVNVWAEG